MNRAFVKVPLASLLARPGGEVSDEVLWGWPLEILEELPGGWRLVRTHYRYTGFLPAGSLLPASEAGPWAAAPKRMVTAPFADLLEVPRVQGRRLGTLPRGAWAALAGGSAPEGWTAAFLCGGRRGFLRDCLLGELPPEGRPLPEEGLREALAQTALSYLGCPYRWGGRTPLGLDCSGLCSQTYLMNGIAIWRDAAIVPGFPIRPIPPEKAGKGDLLFFRGHVALFLGEGRYIHATARKGVPGVTVNSLDPAHPDYRPDLARGILQAGSVFAP